MAGARSSERLARVESRRRCEDESPCRATSSGCAATPASAASTMPSRARAKVPSCPACLGDEARKEWQRLSKELAEIGLLTGIDRNLLAAYCQAHALWVEAVSSIARYGTMVKSPNGCPMQIALCRGRQQAGRHHGADRRQVRYDPQLAHAHPGRRQAARGPFEACLRPWLEPPETTRSQSTRGRWPGPECSPTVWSRLACERHLEDLGSGASRGLRFEVQAARHAIAFFASSGTPRASGPARPSPSPPGRRSSSAACSAGSAPMACEGSGPPTAPCPEKTARARCPPVSRSTCWSPMASRAPRSTPLPPPAIRRESCSTRPSAWSAPLLRSSAGSRC